MPDIVISLLCELYIYYKIPNLRWKELQPGLNKHYMDECEVSQYASETLTLDSYDKQVEPSSLSTEKLFSAHELLHSLVQNSNTNEDPPKAWTYILLSWLFENKHNNSDPFEIIDKAYADFGYPEETSALDRYMPTTEESAKSEEQSMLNWEKPLDNYKQELIKRV